MALDHFDVTRNTTKTVLNAQGVLETVPANVPAFEFNADGTYKGCLIEPSATNLLLRSEEFDNAYWRKNNTTISVSNTAPDGVSSAFLLAETTSDSVHLFDLPSSNRLTATSGLSYTQSIFVKKGSGSEAPDIIQLVFRVASFGSNTGANFNISNGTVTLTNNCTATITPFLNGWFRITATATAIASDEMDLLFTFVDNNPTSGVVPNYVGNVNADVFIWGAQLEEGSAATSYIPTTNATATRNADVITKTGATDLIGQTEGRIIFEVNQPGGLIQVANVGALAEAGIVKVEFRYTPTTQKLFFNDTEVASATGNYDWSGMNKIEIGHDDGSDQPTDVHYRLFSIYKTANS